MILTSAARTGITHAPCHHDLNQRTRLIFMAWPARSKDRYYARALSSCHGQRAARTGITHVPCPHVMASALQGQVLRTHLVIMILTSASRKGIMHAPCPHDLDQHAARTGITHTPCHRDLNQHSKDRYYERALSS
jgi:hypothetical protein